MAKYLHLYETTSAFEADYNGEYYHEPWASLTKQDGDVNYNKRTEEKYIRIERLNGDVDYRTVDTNLTCEDLEQTGNTYKAYLTEQSGEDEPIESEWDVVFDYVDEYRGNVWTLMNDGEPHGTCFVVCDDGEVIAHMFA